MRRRTRLYGLIAALIVASLALAGCGIFENMSAADDADDATDAGDVSEPPTNIPDAPAIDPAVAALLPDAPAPPGSGFRSDSAKVVAATGRPQLLEFFTYW